MVRVQSSSHYMSCADSRQTGNLFPSRLRETHIEKHQNMNYRRNGKLQACEPCRKGKLRCDHHLPVCDRCVKRGRTEKCVYHPAPLTATKRKAQESKISHADEGPTSYRPLSGAGRASTPAAYLAHLEHTNRLTSFSHVSQATQVESSPTASTLSSSVRSQNSISQSQYIDASVQQASKNTRRPSIDQRTGTDARELERGASFVNHTAVLDEHESSIGLTPQGSTAFEVSQERIDQGASVLFVLRDLGSIQKYIDKWFSFAGGVVVLEPMVKIYLDGLSASWKHVLESSRHEDLREMSAQVWNNTSRALSQSIRRDTTAREFCATVTGPGIRWETIGLIVSLVSLVAQSLKGKFRYLRAVSEITDYSIKTAILYSAPLTQPRSTGLS